MADQSVNWTEVEVPVLGMNERTDPVVMPEGQFSFVKNAEYTTISGSLRKRPGLDKVCDNSTIPVANRLATFRDQLLVIDTEGNSSTPPAVYAPEIAAAAYKSIADAVPVTVERSPVISDLTSSLISDMAVANGFAVYVISNPQAGTVTIKVKEIASNSYIAESKVFDNDAKLTQYVRAASSGPSVLCTFSTTDGNIRGVVVNCNGTVPSISSSSVLVTDEKAASPLAHDLAGSAINTPRWFLVYKYDLAGSYAGRVKEFKTNSMTGGWHQNFSTDPSAFSILEHGTDVFVNWYLYSTVTDPGNVGQQEWQYRSQDSVTGATTLGDTTWCDDTALGGVNDIAAQGSTFNPGRVSGISPNLTDSTAVILFHSQPRKYSKTVTDAITLRPMLRWRTATRAGVLGSLKQKRGAHLWSKPWADSTHGWSYAWVGTTGRVAEGTTSTAGESSWSLALLRIPHTANSALLDSTAVGEQLGNPLYSLNSSWGADHSAQSIAVDSDRNTRTVVGVRYVPGEEISGPQELLVRKDHLGRYNSAQFGGATYFAGGVLTQWDGTRYSETNFVVPALVRATVSAAGTGTWDAGWAGTDVSYRVVYETVSPNGEVSRSAVSDLETVHITNDTDIVTLKIEPATLTRRYWNSTSLNGPRVIAAVYRTDIPNSSIMKRIATFDSGVYNEFLSCNPETTEPLSVVDKGDGPTGSTSVGTLSAYPYHNIEIHEILYTDSGEVENTLPYGGCTTICVHKNRLWIAGGDDPELIWYSKERADGRPAEFSVDQTIRLAGRHITAIESTGDLLVAFCTDGIFEISGEGPNATDDPSSGFFGQAFQISPIGCEQPRSIVYIPTGLAFRSTRGIHLVNFERSVVWIGQSVQNTVNGFPTVCGATTVPEKTQLRYAIKTEDSSAGVLLVYDWEEDRWAVWDYNNMDYPADVTGWSGHNTMVLSPDGSLYEENPTKFLDDTTSYQILLNTAWFKFGRVQGYKKIRKFGILMEKLGDFGLEILATYDYTDHGLSATKAFSPTEIAAIPAPGWVRITSPYQKQPSIRLQIRETEDPAHTNTAAFALKSIGFEVGMIPGLKRLPSLQSK